MLLVAIGSAIAVQCPTDPDHPGTCERTGRNLTRVPTLLVSLQFLKLSRNNISDIPDGTFHGQSKLSFLNLMMNQLIAIGKNTLAGASNLDHFNAAHNCLIGTDTDAFRHTLHMKRLDLNDNRISYFPFEILGYLVELSTLLLHHNNLRTLEAPQGFKPKHLTLSLSGNPLHCDGRMGWIKEGEMDGRVEWETGPDGIKLTPTCQNFPGRNWSEISLAELLNGTYL